MENKKLEKSNVAKCLSNTFLIVLTTSQIATIADVPEAYGVELAQDRQLLIQKNHISEKVAISKDRQNVFFRVIGNKGVHCVLVYKTPKMSGYAPFENTKAVIGQDGMAMIAVNLANLADQDILFKVITSDKSDFNNFLSNIKGTGEIKVQIMNGQIANVSAIQAETIPALGGAISFSQASTPGKVKVLPGAASRGK